MRRLIAKLSGCATLTAALVLLTLCLWAPRSLAEGVDGMLRVKLTRLGAPSTVTLSADCDLVADTTGSVLPAGNALTASASGGQLTVQAGGETIATGKSVLLTRAASDGHGIFFAAPSLSNRFCGDLLLSASGNVVSAVLNIYVEDYLYGVVGYMMPPSSGLEALKAQAVAARSYALYQKALNSVEFDLTDTIDGFTFKGRCDGEEYANVFVAVDDTRGQVLMADGDLVCGWCTESNGGQTESAANAFGLERSYTAVADDEYDLYSSGAKKSAQISRDAQNLDARLNELLVEAATRTLSQLSGDEVREVRITAIDGIRPGRAAYNAPSRVLNDLEFDVRASGWNSLGNTASAELTVTVPTFGGLEDWYALSINEQANETVWVEDQGDQFEITFRRSGHGVGLSQRGAQAMANSWQACDAILARYYPGAEIVTLDLVEAESQKTDMAQVTVPAIAAARLQDRANLYTAPSTESEVAAVLAAGAAVDVYAVDGDWAAVGSSGKMGYVNVDDISGFELIGDDVTQLEPAATVRMKANRPLQQLPAGTARALAQLASGDKLTATACSRQWAAVTSAEGVSGFVQMNALELLEEKDDGGKLTALKNRTGKLIEDAPLYESLDADNVLATLREGLRVKVLAKNRLWAKVSTGGKKGYVSLESLKLEAAGKANAIEGGKLTKLKGSKRRTVYVKTATLTMYKMSAAGAKKVTRLKKGQKLLMTAYNKKWAYVTTGKHSGYVLRSGLTAKAPGKQSSSAGKSKKSDKKDEKKTPFGMTLVEGTKYGTVSVDLAVIYRSMNTKSEQLEWAEKGQRVRIGAFNNKWALVRFKGTSGFMQLSDMTRRKSSGKKQNSGKYTEADTTAVTLTDLKLYETADMIGAAIDTIPMDTQVHVTAYQGQAAHVDINGKVGWLDRGYLKKVE